MIDDIICIELRIDCVLKFHNSLGLALCRRLSIIVYQMAHDSRTFESATQLDSPSAWTVRIVMIL